MKKIILSLAALAMAFILPSCIEYETKITLNKDGSGTITEEMLMGADAIAMVQQQAKGQDPFADQRDEAKLKAKASQYGQGVTFVKVEDIKRKDGSKGVRATYAFTNIGLNQQMESLSSKKPGARAGQAKDIADDAKATFEYTNERLTIKIPQDEAGKEDEAKGDAEAKGDNALDPQIAMMTEFLRGMKMSVLVTFASGIAETDASYHADDTITLLELDFDEVMKDPNGLNSLSTLDSKNPGKIGEAIAKIKGAKVETKKEITATVK